KHTPGGGEHLRADRRHGPPPHRQGHDQPARRDRRVADAARAAGRDGGGGGRDRRHPVRVLETALDACRRGGLLAPRGRRPRGGGGPAGGDGARGTGFSYSIEDRLRILHKLDQLGVPFVEGGWPGANPRETEFFRLATSETLKHATLTAFGMTRKAGETPDRSA